MENKEYLQDLKKLINGEMVAAMQYKIIADSIVGDKNLSYIQSHCEEHYQEELDHYTMLVNALMQREDNVELNLSTLVGEALPETVEMTSNNCMDAAEFFSRSEDAAINAYLEFHEKIKDEDPDLDDIITGIISDERDHKLDFDRVINSDEELEVEDSEEDTEEESDESEDDTEETDEPEKDEPKKKDKFNFDFSDDEDEEEIEESRKMRKRSLREENKSWYYGIPGIRFIWHGEWADPEVEYEGKYVYEPYIVDPMWDNYNEDCEEDGIEPNEDDFVKYMQDHEYLVKDFIESAPSSRPDDLEESRKMRKRNRVRESRKPNKGRRLRETKIGYDLLDGNFKPWSGAVSRWKEILENDLLEELDAYLEELYPNGMTEMELNDFLWFEGDEFLDSYLGRDQEDEDYEDDSEEFEDDPEEFEEFVNRKINRVREHSEKPSNNFVERKLHNKEKYSDSINKFAKRIR